MQQQLSPRGKTVEHYQLNTLITATPLVQFWTASHKILKKPFVLKKIKMPMQGLKSDKNNGFLPSSFDLAKYETSLLNFLKLQGSPKCHKLIRTTASTYIVYDNFAGESLMNYLLKQRPTINQLLKLMIEVASELEKFHLRGIVFYLLSVHNIYIDNHNRITLIDWTLAHQEVECQINRKGILQMLESSPHYNVQLGSTSYQSDLYSLGNIFFEVLNKQKQIMSSPEYAELSQLIRTMMSKDDSQRMLLRDVIRSLQRIRQVINIKEPSTPTFPSRNNLDKSDLAQSKINRFKLKRTGSDFAIQIKENQEIIIPQTKSSKGQPGRNNSKSPNSKKLSSTSSEQNLHDLKFIGKIILKRRGLAFFLISLSQFTQEQDLQLTFMLLIKSLSAIKSAQIECQQLKGLNHESFAKISPLLLSEMGRIQRLISRVRQNLSQVNPSSKTLNIQPTNLKYLHLKIKEFVKQCIKNIKRNSLSFSDTVQVYFQLYLLTKTIECGSYELFWDRSFNKTDPISNAGYFNQQKKLGLRFFKSKIDQILERQA